MSEKQKYLSSYATGAAQHLPLSNLERFGGATNRHGEHKQRILYFCPDLTVRSAGIRRLYRHVAILHRHGFDAAVLHTQSGFKVPDQPNVPRLFLETTTPGSHDVVVVPEGLPQIMHRLGNHPCRRFVIALSWDYIFASLPDNIDWRSLQIERVLVVSRFIGQMVSWSMRLPVHLLATSVDRNLYYFDAKIKQPQITYIQRRAAGVSKLQRLMTARNPAYTKRIRWRALADLPEVEYAAEIRSSSIFLNLSDAEGFPTSCMEAMAAGTIVAGFDGMGGRGVLQDDKNCLLVPGGDYVTLAYRLAPFLNNLLNGGSASWRPIIENGLQTAGEYTIERETDSLVQFWQSVL